MSESCQTPSRRGSIAVIREGLKHSPEVLDGLWFTIVLAALSTAGGSIISLVVRDVLDRGLGSVVDLDLERTARMVMIASALLVIVAITSRWSKVRIFTAAEMGLSTLRVKAFAHIHELSTLTQNAQRRGSLVARVTSDVDQVSQFLQFAGILLIVSVGQMVFALIIMAVMSWQLTLVVMLCFVPLVLSLKYLADTMSRAYDKVRASVGTLLAVIAEPVVGAPVIKSFGIEKRTQARMDEAIEENYRLNVRAQAITSVTFGAAIVVGGVANAAVLLIGTWLGVTQGLTLGTLVAFIFLIGLFTGPAQMATQVIADSQNAIASWRRVIDVIETPIDVVEAAQPERLGTSRDLRIENVNFAYPDGPLVVQNVSLTIGARQRVAVVGETGSGKTTFAKLLTRLIDPSSGEIYLGDVRLDRVAFGELRDCVLMVPQEGFLFDATLAENLRYGKADASDGELLEVIDSLGLTDWFSTLPHGLATRVGQRGESLSAGERQLVALARSALADPDIVVLDEATSAVDPQTELRTTRALEVLLANRTSVTIAHRLSTAENADRVLVFDDGRLVEDGTHAELVSAAGVYARLHSSWVAQARLAVDAPADGGPERIEQ
ncbi:MAG: ABC transporter ATP-binding protein [Aeromicrobium sp.]|nr:MAG: ABC transporter ATP-binding protein [Aeromicrobium sp.]